MKQMTVYKYDRGNHKITVSPKKPEDRVYTELIRIIADPGKILVYGDRQTICADVESIEGWTEIDKPEDPDAYKQLTLNN